MEVGIALLAIVVVGDPVPSAIFDCASVHIEGSPINACDERWFAGAFQGPTIHGQPTIEIRYTTMIGSGVKAQSVALLRGKGSNFRMLWSHEQFEAWSGWPAHDGAVVYRWAYDRRRDRINVTGTRTIGTVVSVWQGKARGRESSLPRESYCYVAKDQEFRNC